MGQAIPLKSVESRIQPEVERLVVEGLQHGVYPAGVTVVARGGQILAAFAAGNRSQHNDSISYDTVFDIGTLTQIICTTTILMRLVDEGRLDLNHKVSRYLPGFNVHGKSSVTIGHLLAHTSGLAATHPFFEEIAQDATGKRLGLLTSRGARDVMINAIARGPLKYEPESKQVFSDLGFILLGAIIELLTGWPLEKAFIKFVAQPLGLKNTGFIDLSLVRRRGLIPVESRIAPTEECAWRGKILCGEVHDENTWIMGGVSGHNGLFSTVGDIHTFCSELWRAAQGKSDLISKKILAQFWEGSATTVSDHWRFGWETPHKENGFNGCGFSPRSVGHACSTGCSLWLEPELGIHILLLTNTLFPSRNNRKIYSFREEYHRNVLKLLRETSH